MNHLAECERYDGEVVAAQTQNRKAEHQAEARRQQARKRQAHPERETEAQREQRVGIGAHRIERGITEVEQAGEANHNVEAGPQHDVDQDEGCAVDQGAVGE